MHKYPGLYGFRREVEQGMALLDTFDTKSAQLAVLKDHENGYVCLHEYFLNGTWQYNKIRLYSLESSAHILFNAIRYWNAK